METAVKMLHTGRLTEVEAFLTTRMQDDDLASPYGFKNIVLLDAYIAQGKREEARKLFEKMLWDPMITEPMVRSKIQRYCTYFVRVWSPRIHDLHPMEAIPEHTTIVDASLCILPRGIAVCMRSMNVVYDGKSLTQGGSGDRWKRFINTLYLNVMDTSLRTLSSTRLMDRAFFPRASDVFVGYETPRLFSWQNDLWMLSTSYQVYRSGKAHVVLSRVESDRVASVVPIQCPDMNEDQKDWVPWVHHNEIHFVYKIEPWIVLKVDNPDTGATSVVVHKKMSWKLDNVRQATSPVPYKKGYVMIVALCDTPITHEDRYLYRYVRMNDQLVPTHVSSTWVLWEPELETIHGLAMDNEYIYLTYGHRQKECRITRFIRILLDKSLTWYSV